MSGRRGVFRAGACVAALVGLGFDGGCASISERSSAARASVVAAVATREPANLYPHKLELRAYVDSGRYLEDIAVVARRAAAWLETRAAARKAGERPAVVFDLDETLLFNWPSMSAQDFGYVPEKWDAWVAAAAAPAIEPVRDVFRVARRHGIAVIFITGRPERQRGSTEKNVRAIECGDFAALICKPDGAKGTSAAFKTAARERLTREGWTIVANVGDQESDLSGGFAEKTFKLPNPFYITE